jgi:hypothetical protein
MNLSRLAVPDDSVNDLLAEMWHCDDCHEQFMILGWSPTLRIWLDLRNVFC